MEAVEFATLEWVDWFNNCRLLEPIGNIPPTEAEERHYAMMLKPPWRRNSSKIASGDPGAVQPGQNPKSTSAASKHDVLVSCDSGY
jgi:hypothetical protein